VNRKQRRADRKLSRDATPEEIFPGEHGPAQAEVARTMQTVLSVLRDAFGPNYDITLLVGERDVPPDQNRLPRFNYASTGSREDMLAVLDAFVLKNRQAGPKLDKINEAPPTESKQ
jgi:hypothetical protein